MSQGIGMLLVRAEKDLIAQFAIQEGGDIKVPVFGEFTFTLEKAPLPDSRNIEKMATVDIAQYLAARIAEEIEERRQDALEQRFYD